MSDTNTANHTTPKQGDELAPILTDGEWDAGMVRNVVGNVHAYVTAEHGRPSVRIVAPGAVAEFDRADALLPLLNDALADDSPYKFTALDVAAITNVVQGYRDPEYIEAAQRAASKLLAYLRPAL